MMKNKENKEKEKKEKEKKEKRKAQVLKLIREMKNNNIPNIGSKRKALMKRK